MNWMFTGVACGAMLVASLSYLAFRLKAYWSPATRPANELADFSISRYEPLARLLTSDDFEFLKAQRGFRREIGQKFLRERRRVIRLYLADLAVDFRSLHAAAREMVAVSGAENAHLVGALMGQQITFWRAITAIELRLATGNVSFEADVRSLVEAMEVMRAEMSRLAPSVTAA